MSAIPVNDDERPVSLPCWQAMRAVNGLCEAELKMLMAATVGAIYERYGGVVTVRALSNVLEKARPLDRGMGMYEIAFRVAVKHGLKVSDLLAPDDDEGARRRPIAWARHEAFWECRQHLTADKQYRFSLPQIARFFGGRDHTTVLFGVRAHQRRMMGESAAMRGERGVGV